MERIRRFTLVQRLFHLLLMLSFVNQAATGLGRFYIETSWGRSLVSLFGGYEEALVVHKWVGLFMLALLLAHIVYVAANLRWRGLVRFALGPDSLLPRPQDIKQAFTHVGWMVGMSGPPRLDRWSYWEKFDYWAVFWGLFIIGGTGLILFDPMATSRVLPGWGINVALWIHRIEAMLAMAHVFLIHFFIAHLRRENFPMDLVIFEGSVEAAKLRHERPEWVARLEQQRSLEGLLARPVSPGCKLAFHVFGFAVIIACWYLLAGALLYCRSITWF